MKIKCETKIPGLLILENSIFSDMRGIFKKIVTREDYKALNLEYDIQEMYYSINNKKVIRGMHFQKPPFDHVKIVYVVSGSITDVCLDIRKESKTYGQFCTFELSGNDREFLYIPRGVAHGFLSHEDKTIVHYAQTACYSAGNDCGIRFDSFGYMWGVENPILSERDSGFIEFQGFQTPFCQDFL